MSAGLYTHTTRATGTVLTAAIYNSDHINHITNLNPTMSGGYSDSVAQMRTTANPGGVGSESLPANLAGELERIRFQLDLIVGRTHWYEAPSTNLENLSGAGVPDNSVTNAKLADMAAWTVKARNAGTTGDPSDQSGATLTARTAALNSRILGWLDSGELGYFLLSSLGGLIGGAPMVPQGRLTLTTNTPVMIATASGQTTIRYTPYVGRHVPIFDGSVFTNTDIAGELSQATTDTTKSPAAVANNANYDLFVWNDAGTIRCTRGPAWSSDTTRGTGAGTTELVRINGFWLNAQSITNGPAAQRGTYVGTVRSNGSASIDWIYGAVAASGTAGVFGVWNAYNRKSARSMVGDSTDSWTYNSATWRASNNSSTMRTSFIQGLQEDTVFADFSMKTTNEVIVGTSTKLARPATGIGVDSTTTPSGRFHGGGMQSGSQYRRASHGTTFLGFHFMSAIERVTADGLGDVGTFYGDDGGVVQTGLALEGMF